MSSVNLNICEGCDHSKNKIRKGVFGQTIYDLLCNIKSVEAGKSVRESRMIGSLNRSVWYISDSFEIPDACPYSLEHAIINDPLKHASDMDENPKNPKS